MTYYIQNYMQHMHYAKCYIHTKMTRFFNDILMCRKNGKRNAKWYIPSQMVPDQTIAQHTIGGN